MIRKILELNGRDLTLLCGAIGFVISAFYFWEFIRQLIYVAIGSVIVGGIVYAIHCALYLATKQYYIKKDEKLCEHKTI